MSISDKMTFTSGHINPIFMANIKNFQMWKHICSDSRICISKSFFGFITKTTYKKTGSTIKARTYEYSPSDGERLKSILCTSVEEMAKSIGEYIPKPIVNGNYMVEICMSEDREFIALQLLQFNRLNYESVSELQIFEGNDAKIIGKLFA